MKHTPIVFGLAVHPDQLAGALTDPAYGPEISCNCGKQWGHITRIHSSSFKPEPYVTYENLRCVACKEFWPCDTFISEAIARINGGKSYGL